MEILKTPQYIVLKPKLKTKFDDFFKLFIVKEVEYKKLNLIVDLTNMVVLLDEILKFQKICEEKMELGTSFVVVKPEIDLDKIPDELIIVPTLQEAIDVIEMDEMTRSLDF